MARARRPQGDFSAIGVRGLSKGSYVTSAWTKDVARGINRNLPGDLPPAPPRGIYPGETEGEVAATLPTEFFVGLGLVVAEFNDHVSVVFIDGSATVVDCAKPDYLRGATATRTVNGENQIILPPYGSLSSIVAFAPANDFNTGVPTAPDWFLIPDARMWAEDV